MSTPEQARAEQLAYGRNTLRTSEGYRGRTDAPSRSNDNRSLVRTFDRAPQRTGSKGHDVILKAMQESGQHVTIITSGGGDKFEGVITGRDKFTITLKTKHPTPSRAAAGETVLRVFYKSAVEQFWGEQVRRDIHDTTRDEEGINELRGLTKAVVN